MLQANVSRPDLDDPALATQWRGLAEAAGAPAFLSWSWVGCLARERYPDPVLVETREGERLVGLALFNRTAGRWGATLSLHEAGEPAIDAVFTEHNGPLALPGSAGAVMGATLRAVGPLAARVRLSGVGDGALEAVRSVGALSVGCRRGRRRMGGSSREPGMRRAQPQHPGAIAAVRPGL